MLYALISYCCSNKLAQTQWIEAIHIRYLTILNVRSPKWILQAKIKVSAELCSFLKENLFPCFFQLLKANYILDPWYLSSSTKCTTPASASVHISSLTLILLPASCKDSCDYNGPTHLIISPKPLLPCKLAQSNVPEIRTRTSLGNHYSAHHLMQRNLGSIMSARDMA